MGNCDRRCHCNRGEGCICCRIDQRVRISSNWSQGGRRSEGKAERQTKSEAECKGNQGKGNRPPGIVEEEEETKTRQGGRGTNRRSRDRNRRSRLGTMRFLQEMASSSQQRLGFFATRRF